MSADEIRLRRLTTELVRHIGDLESDLRCGTVSLDGVSRWCRATIENAYYEYADLLDAPIEAEVAK